MGVSRCNPALFGIGGGEQASGPQEQKRSSQAITQVKRFPSADGVGATSSCHPGPDLLLLTSCCDHAWMGTP